MDNELIKKIEFIPVAFLSDDEAKEIIRLVTQANKDAVISAVRKHGLDMQDYHALIESIATALDTND